MLSRWVVAGGGLQTACSSPLPPRYFCGGRSGALALGGCWLSAVGCWLLLPLKEERENSAKLTFCCSYSSHRSSAPLLLFGGPEWCFRVGWLLGRAADRLLLTPPASLLLWESEWCPRIGWLLAVGCRLLAAAAILVQVAFVQNC